MKKLINNFFLTFLLTISSPSWALPPCSNEKASYKHKCFGTFIFLGGGKYEGEWENNKRHGKGMFFSGTLSTHIFKFEGNWKNGKRHGKGKFILPYKNKYSPVQFIGIWDEGFLIRDGTIIFKNGSKSKSDGQWTKKYMMN